MIELMRLLSVVDKCKTDKSLYRIKLLTHKLFECGKLTRDDQLFAGWYILGVTQGMSIKRKSQ